MAKAHTLNDEFTDNVVGAQWTVTGTPAVDTERIRETNERLEIRARPGFTGTWLQSLNSTARFDLTASEVRVEVEQVLNPELNTTTFLTAFNTATNEVYIAVESGLLRAVKEVAGVTTIVEETWYDPAVHRWLRMRERAGTLYYEYSTGGADFVVFATTPSPAFLNDVTLSIGAGTYAAVAAPGSAALDNFNWAHSLPERRVEERRLAVLATRVRAAEVAAARRHDEHHNNDDEVNYPTQVPSPFIGMYSKSLKHDSLGDPDPYSYATMLRALESRDPDDFNDIVLASGTAIKLTNPQAGLAYNLLGADTQERTLPPAPRFSSKVAAHEAGELYWMAVARDVPFFNYGSNTIITAAVNSLNSEFPEFGGTTPVTTDNVFRGVFPGEQAGPYVSQFLLKGNSDPRKPDGAGRDANEGFITYGSQFIDQRQWTLQANSDHLTTFSAWLNAQNGVDTRGNDVFDTANRRFIRNLRDGAQYVHFDQVINAFYNAAFILLSEPTGNQRDVPSATTGRPQVDMEFLWNDGNPYNPPGTTRDSRSQAPFATFGPPHLLDVLGEAVGRALRTVWFQKWFVHRRLRPEEYGGRVHNHIAGARTYPLHTSITTSLSSGGLAPYYGGQVGDKFPTYLLPQAYSEGAPTHPAYGAGHACGSGALTTILKAWFDEDQVIENPVEADSSGLALFPYSGATLTVGGELNKLAGNISLFRNAAGVHWRSDHTESLLLGEAVAMALLQELSLAFNEEYGFFQFTRFDGVIVRIEDGKVHEFR